MERTERGVWRVDVAGDVICLVAITSMELVAAELRVPRARYSARHFAWLQEELDRADPHGSPILPADDGASQPARASHLSLVRPV